MCFSPDADFTAAAVVGGVGIATLRQCTRRELIVGLLPLLFALHQFSEAFVWLGLRREVSNAVGNVATHIYVIYAYAALPMIVPLGLYLIEPSGKHRRWASRSRSAYEKLSSPPCGVCTPRSSAG